MGVWDAGKGYVSVAWIRDADGGLREVLTKGYNSACTVVSKQFSKTGVGNDGGGASRSRKHIS